MDVSSQNLIARDWDNSQMQESCFIEYDYLFDITIYFT